MHGWSSVRYLLLPLWLSGCICSQQASNELVTAATLATKQARAGNFDRDKVMAWLRAIAAKPHPFGSDAQIATANFLEREAKALGATTTMQSFAAETPNPLLLKNPGAPASLTVKKNGINIFARANLRPDADCVVLVASHYDTKLIESGDYLGANDSGSSSVVLLEMLRRWRAHKDEFKLRCDLQFVWFDGEESILPDWHDGERKHPAKIADHTYGSRHVASELMACTWGGGAHKCLPKNLGGLPVVALILLDMVGSPNLKLTREQLTSPGLAKLLDAVLQVQERSNLLTSTTQEVGDDHVPFYQAGIQVIDIIDFSNISHWHRPSDTIDQISPQSLEITYEIASALAIAAATDPKLFSE